MTETGPRGRCTQCRRKSDLDEAKLSCFGCDLHRILRTSTETQRGAPHRLGCESLWRPCELIDSDRAPKPEHHGHVIEQSDKGTGIRGSLPSQSEAVTRQMTSSKEKHVSLITPKQFSRYVSSAQRCFSGIRRVMRRSLASRWRMQTYLLHMVIRPANIAHQQTR